MKRSFAAIGLFIFTSAVAFAQSNRTFVSAGSGSDANPCSRTSPCRSFGAALAVTNAGGEVVALDSGGYGPFTVTQAVGVVSPGGIYAGVTVTSGTGVTVNAGASDVVRLTGLTIVGSTASGTTGIEFQAGSELVVDRCTLVDGHRGIVMQIPQRLSIVHSSISGMTLDSVFAHASSGTPRVMIDDCTFAGNYLGVVAAERSVVFMSNSLIEGSGEGGALASSATADNSTMVIEHCGFSNNLYGVVASTGVNQGSGTIYIAFSTITGSTTSGLWQVNAGVIKSRGNNSIVANATDTLGTIGSFGGQ